MEVHDDSIFLQEQAKNLHTILITGSEGRIGKIVTNVLSNRFRSVIRLDNAFLKSEKDNFAVDITNKTQLSESFNAMGQVNAIVHLAGNPHPDASFESVFKNNVVGTKNVLDEAVKHGVKRVVIASSTHTVGGYEGYPGSLPNERNGKPFTTEDIVKGDSPYGWSKVEIEKLAKRYYKKYGIEIISLRFGFVTGDDKPAKGYEAHWLSYRDAAQVMEKALTCGVSYGVYFATSDIKPAMFDISTTKRDLNYKPQDRFVVKS